MSAFIVIVRTLANRHQYPALATDSVAAAQAAVDRFGVCSVTVKVFR